MCLLVRNLLSDWDCGAGEERLPRRQKLLGLSLSTEKANTFIKSLSIWTIQLCVESTWQYILIIFLHLQAVFDQSVATWQKTGSLPHLILRAVQAFLLLNSSLSFGSTQTLTPICLLWAKVQVALWLQWQHSRMLLLKVCSVQPSRAESLFDFSTSQHQ